MGAVVPASAAPRKFHLGDSGEVNRDELAKVLRRARGRLSPADVGLPAGDRRRVAGLRREEVATLAGISVDYVVRLEQGRGPRPSTSVLASLSRALRLTDDERRELFDLADAVQPRDGEITMLVRASILRLLDRLEDNPAVVLSAKSDILAWNSMAAALLGDFSQVPARQRNLVWQRFLGKPGRVSLTAEEAEVTGGQSIASLRSTAAKYPSDPGLLRLLAELQQGSPDFRRRWEETSSAPWRSHTKTVEHPDLGSIALDCDAMQLPDADQAVVVYSAEAGSHAAEMLALLKVIGTQQLSPSRAIAGPGHD